jgi:hypothetical protein
VQKLLLTGLVLALSGSVAYASPITLTAVLSGPAENPPTASPGTGFATVTIDPEAHTMRIQVTFMGLLSPTTASHIHCCVVAPGNAGVATQTPSFAGFPLGVLAGSMDTTYDTTNAIAFNPAFVTANGGTLAGAEAVLFNGLLNGQAYLNIHTMQFGGGEIRGFLQVQPTTAVPEPGTWSLLGLGLATIWAGARYRARRR